MGDTQRGVEELFKFTSLTCYLSNQKDITSTTRGSHDLLPVWFDDWERPLLPVDGANHGDDDERDATATCDADLVIHEKSRGGERFG